MEKTTKETEKKIGSPGFSGTLALIGVFVVLLGGYFAVKFTNTEKADTSKTAIIDRKTGLPLSQEEVSAIAEKLERESMTHTLVGTITAKLRDSVQAEITLNGKKQLLQIKFAPNMVFSKSMETSLDTTDPGTFEIHFADMKVGDTFTVTFPEGVLVGDLKKAQTITINNLLIDAPHGPDFSED